ncbi:hypothetical protein K438DRAFT_1808870 [Mycena galopus ATCC 62051]|nr:hypothetical protein K438DRAFT_1808870 [Mycena galopus ATCC 62051]
MKHPGRLYTALPRVGRVRSNSASRALGRGPPNPNSNNGGTSGNPNANGTGHAPLALAAPHSPTTHSPHPAQLALLFPYTPGPACSKPAGPPSTTGGARASRRRGPRYTLDVGAYGIPKRGHAHRVGEDAYFVRENAMGVADGVGGWARVKHPAHPPPHPHPNPYAHPHPHPQASRSRPVVTPWRPPSSSSRFAPYPVSSSLPTTSWGASLFEDGFAFGPSSSASPSAWPSSFASSPRRRRRHLPHPSPTLGAHVVAVPAASAGCSQQTNARVCAEETPAGKPPDKETATHTQPQTQTGTSTSKPQTETQTEPKTIPCSRGAARRSLRCWIIGSSSTTGTGTEKKNTPTLTPVLKIAHVGDCMGMLVRGGEVAWRSEEMWWRWNTPVQLSAATSSQAAASTAPGGTGKTEEKERAGWWRHFNLSSSSSSASASCPSSSSPAASTPAPPAPAPKAEITPSSAAHLFTLPVKAGDIVILASDGLSDNLWDEDVLEEVGRVGRVFEAGLSSSAGAGGKKGEGEGDEEGVFEMGELDGGGVDGARLRRRTLAGMLSEALCSRARRVATRRAGGRERGVVVVGSPTCSPGSASSTTSPASSCASSLQSVREEREREREGVRVRDEAEWTEEDDTPFARRARETGRVYRGGKNDDISVIVAVIAPAEEHPRLGRGRVEAARAAGSDL